MIFSHAFLFTQAKEVMLVTIRVPIKKELENARSGFWIVVIETETKR